MLLDEIQNKIGMLCHDFHINERPPGREFSPNNKIMNASSLIEYKNWRDKVDFGTKCIAPRDIALKILQHNIWN